jgi:type IV pilus assembly protein PilN
VLLINLLPHRAERRKRLRALFYSLTGLTACAAAAVALFWYMFMGQLVSHQQGRNGFLEEKIKVLEVEIQDVASLRNEIDVLKARQKAVEDLQVGRNTPVNILDELVRQTPEGIFLISIAQDAKSLSVVGKSLSNERVSEFLRNTTNSGWFNKPELIAIEASRSGLGPKSNTRVLDFSMKIGINRPQDNPAPVASSPSAPKSAVPKG